MYPDPYASLRQGAADQSLASILQCDAVINSYAIYGGDPRNAIYGYYNVNAKDSLGLKREKCIEDMKDRGIYALTCHGFKPTKAADTDIRNVFARHADYRHHLQTEKPTVTQIEWKHYSVQPSSWHSRLRVTRLWYVAQSTLGFVLGYNPDASKS